MSELFDTTASFPHVVFQAVAVPIVALLFLRCAYRVVRRDRSRWGAFLGAVIWFAAGVAILRPEVTNELAEVLGIGRGADLVLYLLAIAFVASSFYFYQKYHRLESDLTRVVRRLAVREAADRWPPAGEPENRGGSGGGFGD